MKIIACVDDDFGMAFNKRRQSRDCTVIEQILKNTDGRKLWMNSYSQELFEPCENILVDDNFLEKAQDDDFCFVENVDLQNYEDRINEVILFFWNRRYPSDIKFEIDLEDWESSGETEFEGKSHEKITQKIYRRKQEWEEKIQVRRKILNKITPHYRLLL